MSTASLADKDFSYNSRVTNQLFTAPISKGLAASQALLGVQDSISNVDGRPKYQY